MQLILANFNGKVAGTNLANTDRIPSKIDNVILGAGNTLAYDAISNFSHLPSVKHVLAGTNVNALYNFGTGTVVRTYGRAYLRMEAASTNHDIFWDSNNGWSVAANFTAKQLFLKDSGGTNRATQVGTWTTSQWFRIEWLAVNSTTAGSLTCNVYLNPNSTAATETISYSNFNTLASTTFIQCGSGSSGATTFYTQCVELNDNNYPGPYLEPPTARIGLMGV